MISGPGFFLDLGKARLRPSRPRDRMTTGRNRAAVRWAGTCTTSASADRARLRQ